MTGDIERERIHPQDEQVMHDTLVQPIPPSLLGMMFCGLEYPFG